MEMVFLQYQEKFITDCIRKFPYCEAALLQQQVMSIAPVEIGNDRTAFSVLTQALTDEESDMVKETASFLAELRF
ncbi:ankyrin repeat and MYND domain-containing protein 2-like [Oncorhynchus masou masou]|uniref:ankyrin repeat and MYND domain-containing protein 2-like n=1 Tax=Oncorhynchus masou masou TaxID=90313 RepID=UPI0031842ED0